MKVTLARRPFLAASLAASATLGASFAWAQDDGTLGKITSKGADFLKKSQLEDGSFNKGPFSLGITSLAVSGLLASGLTADDPAVKNGLKVLEANVKDNGGIFGRMATYETSVAVVALSAANKDGRYDKILKNADKFLRQIPFDAKDSSLDKADARFGGLGYGGAGRPDLSNTAFFIEALRSSGAGADDQAIQNALTFVNRCQNLESEYNNTEFAGKVNDGGFYYSPVVNEDQKSEVKGAQPSYGAMSYSGLKSMIFAGLTKDDKRVQAVLKWIGKNYSVANHPGRGESGLYYYYVTFSKGLAASGLEEIEDDKGAKHNWRKDLTAELAKRQNADGSWVNSTPQFMEGDPNLCTSFALISLGYCKPAKK